MVGLGRVLNASFDVWALTPTTIRDLMQENEDGDTQFTKIPQVAGGGAESYYTSPGRADEAWPLPTSPNLSPDASSAPCCSYIGLLATLNVLGIFMPLRFCTHCSYFLECSYSTSNCQTLTQHQRPTTTAHSL